MKLTEKETKKIYESLLDINLTDTDDDKKFNLIFAALTASEIKPVILTVIKGGKNEKNII
jgi:hypothetical protein